MASSDRKKMFVAASIAGLMTVSASLIATNAQADMNSPGEPCYGINACKGTGDCGGKGYSCAGNNACKGQGWLKLEPDVCTRIQGGTLTAPQA
jgi:uncharacterized membrane protein